MREDALTIPWVHAFQGDNPMASEFSSHIGMTGTCMCRVCEIYRKATDSGQSGGKEVGGADDKKKLSEFLSECVTICKT